MLADLLLHHPFADTDALVHTIDRSVSKSQLIADAQRVCDALGDVQHAAVAVQLPDGPELIAAMFGIWLAGGVYVPVNSRYPKAEVDHIIDLTRPAALMNQAGVQRFDDPVAYDTDIAFILWTSGTTGTPKPIQQTHAGYLEFLDRVLGPLRAGNVATKRPRPNLIPVSMALNAGLYNALFGLRAGAALVIMDRFECDGFARLVRRFEIRSTVLPPAAIAMLNDSAIDDLTPLAYVRSITAPLSPLQARRFTTKFGAYVLNGYGQAEIGEVVGWTAADAKAHPDKIGAVGKPHPGVLVKTDADGRLLVKPPQIASGIEDRLDDDGFLDTGDLARIDDDGFVWIEGRASDVINRGGNKVFPDAVEEVLRLSDAVDDVAVVGIADDRLGEVPVAFVVGRPITDEKLVALCREHLVAYKVPTTFYWVSELPRSEVGKVLRRSLADTVVRGTLQQQPSGGVS